MSEASETTVLENTVADLRAEGFDVLVQPSRQAVPPFLKGYSPDAIAIRGNEKIVIEVLNSDPSAKQKLEELQKLVANDPVWQLRAIWINSSPPIPVERVPRKNIEKAIEGVKSLLADDSTMPALLMAWATFEALGRGILPEKFSRPQTPGRLVDVLAEGGQLTPTEADQLRVLVTLRNRVIHGGLQQTVSREDLNAFVGILETLVNLLPL
jgi:REase_AHJR-like